MKRILKIVGGFVAVVTLSCLLAAPAQARTFVSVNVGFGGYGYYPWYAAYYPGYCYRAGVLSTGLSVLPELLLSWRLLLPLKGQGISWRLVNGVRYCVARSG